MRIVFGLVIFTVALSSSVTLAESVSWNRYGISETGTSVDIPSSIFTDPAGKPDGYGQQFRTSDGRADLTIQATPNSAADSPAAFLVKKNPPSHILYKRITPNFLVVSSIRDDKIWYDRCNFSTRWIHCVLINYPANEKRQWDGIVTRVSRSLSGG
jgi:hypothetical protein